MNPWPGKGMISLAEFGEYTGCSAKVLKGMIARGELQAQRFGRHWRIPRAEAFRVMGIADPEGHTPVPTMSPRRAPLSPRLEAAIQSFAAR